MLLSTTHSTNSNNTTATGGSPGIQLEQTADNTADTRKQENVNQLNDMNSNGNGEKMPLSGADTAGFPSTTTCLLPFSVEGVNTFIQDRSFIAKNHQRDGHARYAIKMLSKSTLAGKKTNVASDHKRFIAGVVDLAMEVKYLSIIQHPHIIKMRGIAQTHPCSGSFFIILDRLYDTLSERMKGWKKQQKRMSGLGSILDLKGSKKEQALGQRLVVAYNICSALHFLHQNK